MKIKNTFLSLALVLAASGVASSAAHADLLTYYNFNDATNTSGVEDTGAFTSDAGPTATQTTTITTTFTNTTANITNFAGTTVNGVTGETAGQAISFLGGGTGTGANYVSANNGKSFQFSFNGTGQTNIGLSYATRNTSTGFTNQAISYSTDGTNFVNFTNNASLSTTFTAFNTGPITAIDNAANITFRFTLTGATDASGNNRFDNIQVNSNVAPVPEPSTIALFVIGLGGMAFAVRRKKAAESAAMNESGLLAC